MTNQFAAKQNYPRVQNLSNGFTLIELALILVILGVIAILAIQLVPKLTDRFRLDETASNLQELEDSIIGFAYQNNRLPCPDTTNTGIEDCTADVGTVAYNSLGLSGPAIDEARLPLRYGVYRNAGSNADLADLSELFEPALPDTLTVTTGSVTGCNETLVDPVIRIAYKNPPVTTLEVASTAGFAVDEFIGFSNIVVGNEAQVQPPAPSAPGTPFAFQNNCPCDNSGMNLSNCSVCSGFQLNPSQTPAGGAAFNTIAGNDSTNMIGNDSPFMTLRAISGNTLSGPASAFMPGDRINELYGAPFEIGRPGRTVRDFDDLPLGTTTSYRFHTGVTAIVTSVTTRTAQIEAINGNVLTLAQPVASQFVVGDVIYSTEHDATTTVTGAGQVTNQTVFTSGETVTNGSGGSATILGGTLSSASFVVDGAITGTISVGDTITGGTSGTTAEVVQISEDFDSTPSSTAGTISFTAETARAGYTSYTNELDFCQSIKNAIAAVSTGHSTSQIHTINRETTRVTINPAYLLVSGGVEDADGDATDIAFDGDNEDPAPVDELGFESPERKRNDSTTAADVYDDVVFVRALHNLAEEFSCSQNISMVNALATAATAQRNLAEVAFNRNEQAIGTIALAFRAYEMAKAAETMAELQLSMTVVSGLISAYSIIKNAEGAASAIPAGIAQGLAATASIASLIIAGESTDNAQSTYDAACVSQEGTAAALTTALNNANAALTVARRANAWGGVR